MANSSQLFVPVKNAAHASRILALDARGKEGFYIACGSHVLKQFLVKSFELVVNDRVSGKRSNALEDV